MRFHRVDGWLGWILAPMPHEPEYGDAQAPVAADGNPDRNPGPAAGVPPAQGVSR